MLVNYSIALPGLVETSSKELQEILGLHYNKEKCPKTLANQHESFTVTIQLRSQISHGTKHICVIMRTPITYNNTSTSTNIRSNIHADSSKFPETTREK
jgi:hypothetical protein